MKKLQLKHKHVIILSAVIILGICICTIALFEEASERFDWRFDMTDSRLYALSDTTYDLMNGLTQPITVTVFSSQEDYFSVAGEILDRYDNYSDLLSVVYADPYTQPMTMDYFHDRGIMVEQNDAVFENGTFSRIVKLEELYTTDSTGSTVTTIQAEQMFTSAIHNLTRTEQPSVLLTSGHNEAPSSALLGILEGNGFVVAEKSVSVSGIDPKTNMIIIANPSRDFEQGEIAELSSYMENGGTVLAFLGTSAGRLPLLEGFMEQYGLGVDSSAVLDQTLKTDNNAVNVIGIFMTHDINTYFADNQYYPVLPQSRPVIIAQQIAPGLDIDPLLISSDSSYTKSLDDMSSIEQNQDDPTGPFVLSAISQKTLDGNKKATLILTGTGHLYADDIMAISSYANRELITQMLDYCTPDHEVLSIPAKQISVGGVAVLPSNIWTLAAICVGICVAILFFGGTYVARRRRV